MKSTLKEMLQDIINGNEEAAGEKLHQYITQKTRQVTGLAEQDISEEELTEEEVDAILESATDEELEEAVRVMGQNAVTGQRYTPKSQEERDALARTVKDSRYAAQRQKRGDSGRHVMQAPQKSVGRNGGAETKFKHTNDTSYGKANVDAVAVRKSKEQEDAHREVVGDEEAKRGKGVDSKAKYGAFSDRVSK